MGNIRFWLYLRTEYGVRALLAPEAEVRQMWEEAKKTEAEHEWKDYEKLAHKTLP